MSTRHQMVSELMREVASAALRAARQETLNQRYPHANMRMAPLIRAAFGLIDAMIPSKPSRSGSSAMLCERGAMLRRGCCPKPSEPTPLSGRDEDGLDESGYEGRKF